MLNVHARADDPRTLWRAPWHMAGPDFIRDLGLFVVGDLNGDLPMFDGVGPLGDHVGVVEEVWTTFDSMGFVVVRSPVATCER